MQFSDVLPGGLPPNLHVPEDWLNGSMNCHMKNGLGRKEGVNPTSRLEFNFGLNQILGLRGPLAVRQAIHSLGTRGVIVGFTLAFDPSGLQGHEAARQLLGVARKHLRRWFELLCGFYLPRKILSFRLFPISD